MPVIPKPESADDGGLTRRVVDIDGEVVKQDEIVLGEKIVGVESVTMDQHGPGARLANPLPTPQTPGSLPLTWSAMTSFSLVRRGRC